MFSLKNKLIITRTKRKQKQNKNKTKTFKILQNHKSERFILNHLMILNEFILLVLLKHHPDMFMFF
jgi:hypothetical protein